MTSSSREDTVSPSSSNTDRRDQENDLEDDDCLSDLDSEISDPSHLEEIDPVSESQSASPPPNPLITNNPFLPPHLQHPVRTSSFDIVRPPPPPGQLTPGILTTASTSSNLASLATSPISQPELRHTSSPSLMPRPLFKPHELGAISDRSDSAMIRSEQLQSRPDRSPQRDRSPGAEFIKREPPHPAFTPHHEMLTHFAAARAEFLHREQAARERGLTLDFNPRDLRVDFSKAHDLVRQDFGKSHDRFSPECLNSFSRQNGVLGSAS